MTKKMHKRIVLISIFLLCLLGCVYAANKKGVTYDEIITFQRASEMFADHSQRVDFEEQKNFYNKTYTSQNFYDNLRVKEGESFFNQDIATQFVDALFTKRTYNVLLNAVMSLGDGQFNPWYSMGINLFLYVLTLFFMDRLAKKFKVNDLTTILILLFYGLSVAGIQPIIFLRFYELYILIALLYMNIGVYLYQSSKIDLKWFGGVLLTLILAWFGYLNAEYMMIYVAAFSLAFFIVGLVNRQWRKVGCYVAVYGLAGFCFLLKKLDGLKADYARGGLMAKSIDKFFRGSIYEFAKFLAMFLRDIVMDGGVILLVLAGVILLFLHKEKKQAINRVFQRIDASWVLVFITIITYILVVARVAPFEAWRYTSIMQPLVVLLALVLLEEAAKDVKIKGKKGIISALLLFQFIYLLIWGADMGCLQGEVRYDMKEEVNQQLGDSSNIMFATGDTGDLYYGAALWPQEGETYVTTLDLFQEETEDKNNILNNKQIYVWARNEETWEEDINLLMNEYGYINNQLVMDTGSGRWLIYKCERE